MSLQPLLDLSLVGRAGAPALDDATVGPPRTLTFGDVDARANAVARLLRARGFAAGDRLAFFLPNRVEVLDLYLACVRLGVIVVPMNALYKEREVAHLVADSAPKVVVTTADRAPLLPAGTPWWDVASLAREAAEHAGERVAVAIDGDAIAALVYTSGTTGRAKGAMLTRHNLAANAVALTTCWQITAADRYLAVLPLFHVHGLANGVHCWLASGCRMRLEERFDAARAGDVLRAFRPTLVFGVPAVYVRLLELDEATARDIGSHARLFVSGSAPLPAHVHAAFEARYGHRILERYGMSETLMTIGNPYAGERRAGSVGFPFPGTSVRILDPDGAEVPNGTTGELWVRGPTVCAGYWNRPDATAAAFVDGWFRTGDLGERSDDGYFTLRGRGTDLIISSGFNVYPREIEDVLLEIPGVREAVVVGAPHERKGEVPVAYVVADDPFDADALRAECARSLASFKVPVAVVRLDTLPRTALGKVQKHLLPSAEGVAR
ncbi:class I adenylate-forming enzyme family protein [Gemmatirosa kalamazoonensis]|uniref:class I adenylate-forming enzyme family protein n=1 Tax=Gemmatirosa kalamazoonensis TaxID=861299 RepID=UPI00046D50E4|nr:AMP-binding protein [Gemmatirosa kalamazoonensis]